MKGVLSGEKRGEFLVEKRGENSDGSSMKKFYMTNLSPVIAKLALRLVKLKSQVYFIFQIKETSQKKKKQIFAVSLPTYLQTLKILYTFSFTY